MTNAQMITRLRSAAKDTDTTRPRRSDATYALILTDAQNFLNLILEMCRMEFTLNLVVDQAEYDVDEAFVAFPQGRLRQEAGCVYWATGNLLPTSPEKLDATKKGWRDADSGTPTQFYLQLEKSGDNSLAKLGLSVPPSSDFIGDVPTLTYYAIYRPAAIAAGSSDLPFDNNPVFTDLHHRLLILHAMWTIDLEDGNLANPDTRQARWAAFMAEVDNAREWIPGRTKARGGLRFAEDWR